MGVSSGRGPFVQWLTRGGRLGARILGGSPVPGSGVGPRPGAGVSGGSSVVEVQKVLKRIALCRRDSLGECAGEIRESRVPWGFEIGVRHWRKRVSIRAQRVARAVGIGGETKR